jgi:nitroreductase
VWNFQLALHARGYGPASQRLPPPRGRVKELLQIPAGYAQGCLLPVGRLRADRTFGPARRRPLSDVVAVDTAGAPSAVATW